jgi:hypothetical protein
MEVDREFQNAGIIFALIIFSIIIEEEKEEDFIFA